MSEKRFHASIVTPEGKVFEGEVSGVRVPGSEGSFEMKAGHAPIVSALEVGHIRILSGDEDPRHFAVSYGFVEMSENRLTILAESAEYVEDIDVARAREAKERALMRMRDNKSPNMNYERVLKALKRADNRLKIAERYSRAHLEATRAE
ncbi:MAG: ATP synthase F1 subunit epsilon [Balneolaceae bacterium]